MHESTSRLLCRLAFLAICILPTFATFGWIGYRRSSWAHTALERRLSDELGLKATFARAFNPRPSKYVLEDLKLHVVHQPAIAIPLVEAEEQGGVWRIRAAECNLSWSHRRRLWETLNERLAVAGNQTISLQIGTVQFDEPAMPSLTKFAAESNVNESGVRRSSALFTLEGVESTHPIVAQLDAAANQHDIDIVFDSGDAKIPSKMLAAIFPSVQVFGEEATYSDIYVRRSAAAGDRTTIRANVNDIELGALVNKRFDHTLVGKANLNLQEAVLVNGKLQAADGWLTSDSGGRVSVSLVQDASHYLGILISDTLMHDPRIDQVGFDQLGIQFQLRPGQLSIRGCCDQMPGVILANTHRALALQPEAKYVPSASLIQTLDADETVTVPATAEAAKLLDLLVVPAVAEEPSYEELRR
ncbi:hypothetical protein LOC68_25420 [Blastopirellula sp. JC732]|uniref:Uncharacterized protein n=1 Tax=Blastopirellula sediminis TaxID=2894196 RepID=A0A9X1SHZ8_9BACT|nr:hypothetical protein [Blastopirellula sediminis]MCC9604950.1 hypothetical protein [Blastopirellula sediminis]MCC9631750.1 hypothetical protein [Blastopirellula sediminis]